MNKREMKIRSEDRQTPRAASSRQPSARQASVSRTRRGIKLIVAIVLLILGIAGLILPVLQGFLFLAAGLLLLADMIPAVARLVQRLESRDARVAKFTGVAHRTLDALFESPWLVAVILLCALIVTAVGIYMLVE